MSFEPATQKPLKGPFNRDTLRLWASDTEQVAGNTAQVILAGDLFDELLFGNAEEFKPLVGTILDAEKQYRARVDLITDLSISIINLPNGKMVLIYVTPVKKDAKFLINGYPVIIDPVNPTMVIGLQTKDDLDNTGRGLFIASQASDTIEPPKILTEPEGGTFIEGDVADVIATAIGYKDVIAIKNGDVLDGIKAAALPVPVLADTADIYVFGFVHPKDSNLITWTKPASIKRGEAEPAKIRAQSQSLSVDAGAEVTLFADVTGTPPPLVKWVEKISGANGPVVATGREFTIKVLNTRTFVPIAVNRYKVGVDGKFNPNGALKDFSEEGDPITVTKVGLPQAPPNVTMDDVTVQSTLYHTLASGETLDMFEGTLDASTPNPILHALTLQGNKVVLTVGDVNLTANLAGIRYAESLTHYASPWATNAVAFEGSLIAAPTNLQFLDEDYSDIKSGKISWTKSSDTLDPSTQEYSANYSSANRTWTDIADNKLLITQNIAAGDFAVREKARTGKPASAALVNSQAFITKFSSNFTFPSGTHLQSAPGNNIVYYDSVDQFDVVNNKYDIFQVFEGNDVNFAYFVFFQINNDAYAPNKAVTFKVYDDNGTGATQFTIGDVAVTNVKWRQIKGKPGNGTYGYGLRNYFDVNHVAFDDTFADFESPFPSTIKVGDKIRLKAALKSFDGPQQDFAIIDTYVNGEGVRIVKLESGLNRKLIGGAWELIVS